MAEGNKDLEELTKEHKDLSDQLRRAAILSLTVLTLLVISFARACEKVNGVDARNRVCQIKKVGERSGSTPNISYIFSQFEDTTCTDPCLAPRVTAAASPGPTPSSSPTPAITNQAVVPESTGSEAQAAPTPTEAQRNSDRECQAKLEAALEASAEEWFGVEAPIPGVKVNLDLRYWVILLPFLFFLSGIYLHTLRMKRRVVEALAAHKLSCVSPEDVSPVSSLYFDKHSRYKRFPGGLGEAIFITIYLLLPIYLLIVYLSLAEEWSDGSLLGMSLPFGTLLLYSVSYGHLVTNRLHDEIVRVTNQPPPPNFLRSALNRVKAVIQSIAKRVSPRFPISLGSVLLFITLTLTISHNGCADKRYTGYDIVVGTEGAEWYIAQNFIFETVSSFDATEGRIMYTMVLLLALVSAMLVLIPPFYSQLSKKRFRQSLLILSFGAVVLTFKEFSSGYLFLAPWSGLNGLIVWLVFMVCWIWYSLSTQTARRQKWKRIRVPLLVFSIPFMFMAWLYAFDHLYLPGLMVYLVGVQILFVGLLQIQYRFASLPEEGEQSAATFKFLKY